MVFKNYYKILGLTNNIKATQEDIKSAYREQAKKYHPDVNMRAEERFKDINEAYRILSDPSQKKKYDRSWYNYIGKKIKKETISNKELKVNDLVNMFFGENTNKKVKKSSSQEAIKGENIETQISISIKEAFDGTSKKVALPSEDGQNKIVTINIPAGIKNGQIMRILNGGKPGLNGGIDGDLLLKINIINSSTFKLVNNDIYANLYVTPWDAALGSKVSVENIDGDVSILIPKGTQSGDNIAIPNKGYYINKTERGKLVINIQIAIPKKLTDQEKELFNKLKEISNFNPNNTVDIK